MYQFEIKCDTFLELHPVTKLLVFIATNAVMLGVKSYRTELIFFGGLVVLALLEKIYVRTVECSFLYIVFWGIDLLFGAHASGILIVLIVFSRVIRMFVPILFSAYILIESTSINEFVAVFQKFHLPSGFIISFSVMARFIPTVHEEAESIRQALSYRGIAVGIKNVICHPVKLIEFFLVPLMISSMNVVDELAAATMTRGLDPEQTRSNICEVRFGVLDALITIAMIACMIGVKGGYFV